MLRFCQARSELVTVLGQHARRTGEPHVPRAGGMWKAFYLSNQTMGATASCSSLKDRFDSPPFPTVLCRRVRPNSREEFSRC